MQPLLSGRRAECFELVRSELDRGTPVETMVREVVWPSLAQVDRLYRDDRINSAVEHMATRITRMVADQIQVRLPTSEPNDRRILIICADSEPEELGAQMCADLFESKGWKVWFLGGGVPNDEIRLMAGQLEPTILMIYGTQPSGVPGVRKLIDQMREIGVNPTMNVLVSGGVYNRADGLWEEVNADLSARDIGEALTVAENAKPRTPEIRLPGAPKKRRRRRRPQPVAHAGV